LADACSAIPSSLVDVTFSLFGFGFSKSWISIAVDVDIALDVLVENQIRVIFFFQFEIAHIHTKYYCTGDFE